MLYHPGVFVGEYVPLYFCPCSVMLCLLYMGILPIDRRHTMALLTEMVAIPRS